jgi:hypothetical protein
LTNIFNAVELPARWRRLAVTAHRTRPDFAGSERDLVDDPRYAEAEKIVLVMDPLHTHNPASFDNAIADEEARRLMRTVGLARRFTRHRLPRQWPSPSRSRPLSPPTGGADQCDLVQ